MASKEKPSQGSPHFEMYGSTGFYVTLNLDDNQKAKTRFIQSIEAIIRTSMEYQNFVKYLKSEAKLVYCDILRGLDEEAMKELSLEIHHYPFTLYDITEAVLNRYLMNNQDFSRLSIANEVMGLHYSLKVGLIPLTVSMHQLAHSGGIMVDVDNIFGGFQDFVEEYKLFITDEATAKLKVYVGKSRNKELLKNNNQKTLEINPVLMNLDYKPTSGDAGVDSWEEGGDPPWDTADDGETLKDF